MMETTKRQSYWWWFDSHKNSHSRSQWLQSTLSELDEKTKAMLRIIEEDADSFAQRAEMYYKKRPQLVSMVEDFYRAHRSLAEQFDHLRHDPSTRRTSPLARSFSISMGQLEEKLIDPRKTYDGCFTKLAYDSDEILSSPLSKGSSEKSLQVPKRFGGRYTELAYDSEESVDSEVDDPIPEVNYECVDLGEDLSSGQAEDAELIVELDRLREENIIQKKLLMDKVKAIEELNRKLSQSSSEVMELKEEAEKLRMENVEMYLLKMKDAEERETMTRKLEEEKEQLVVENATLNMLLQQKDEEKVAEMKLREELATVRRENEEQREMLEEKGEEKREVIRQLSLAIEMLKGENVLLKKSLSLASESSKRWKPFELQMLKGFGKLFNFSTMSRPTVVPL